MSDAPADCASVSQANAEAATGGNITQSESRLNQIESVLHSTKSRLHSLFGEWEASRLEAIQELEKQHGAQRQEAVREVSQQLAAAHDKVERMKVIIHKERERTEHLAAAWHQVKQQKVREALQETSQRYDWLCAEESSNDSSRVCELETGRICSKSCSGKGQLGEATLSPGALVCIACRYVIPAFSFAAFEATRFLCHGMQLLEMYK